MAATAFSIMSVVLNVVFAAVIIWLAIKYLKQQRRIKELVNELGTDSLEHYLDEIRKRGFDFTLKPKGKAKK